MLYNIFFKANCKIEREKGKAQAEGFRNYLNQ